MASLSLRWSDGNGKLRKTQTVSFGLPAFASDAGFRTCPGAGACARYCYARQGRYLWPQPKAAREFNLAIVRSSLATFELLAVADLERIPNRSIRVHDSGDFFSQAYLEAWFRIIARFPKKRFYCYSKSVHLDWRGKPANFQIVQSVGGKYDARINKRASHTRVFVTKAERRAAGYCDGNQTDRAAMAGVQRIGFVYHGNEPLSAAMQRYLRKGDE